jgi:transcriptional regulator with XRE-family HTH domain
VRSLHWICITTNGEKMEFNEKLQKLRAQSGLTQEQLAEKLCVSRVTVSKWESGRGYPHIESLKVLAKELGASVDALLSNDELIDLASDQKAVTRRSSFALVYGVLDFMCSLLLVLPIFGMPKDGRIVEVALTALTGLPLFLLISYYLTIVGTMLFGVVQLAFQNLQHPAWVRIRLRVSLSLTIFGIILFIASQEPYVATLLVFVLISKGYLLTRPR